MENIRRSGETEAPPESFSSLFFFQLFPSGVAKADHLPPFHPIPFLLCFDTSHPHLLLLPI